MVVTSLLTFEMTINFYKIKKFNSSKIKNRQELAFFLINLFFINTFESK